MIIADDIEIPLKVIMRNEMKNKETKKYYVNLSRAKTDKQQMFLMNENEKPGENSFYRFNYWSIT